MSAIAGVQGDIGRIRLREQGSRMLQAWADQPADVVLAWEGQLTYMGAHNQWITPESVGVPNPYYDQERGLTVVADAIIDNREELFDNLGVHRRDRASISDQELILLAYDRWGIGTAARLIGDFAFVIRDERNGRLYGARDFSGGRMLYYSWDGAQFRFCSMIEPMLGLPAVTRAINERWLAQYLAISTVVDAASTDQTVYEDIRQIPPAHYFVLENDKLGLSRYCMLESSGALKLSSDNEYVEAFQEVFQQAIDARVRTKHGVGAQLSGGLDSGAVVSFAARRLREENRTLQTFSYVPVHDFIDYTSKWYMPNERPYIEKTVTHIGGIQSHCLDFEGLDPYSDMDDMLNVMEMPYKFYSNSFWLKGIFKEASDRNIGVLLNGGRGNLSISWGDAIPYYARLLKRMKWIKLMGELRSRSYAIGSGRGHLLSLVSKEAFPFLRGKNRELADNPYHALINPAFAARTQVYKQLREYGIGDSGWLASGDTYKDKENHFRELFHWNASNTLAAKLSHRYKLWKRDPTNDLRVIRFCLSLPEDQYVKQGMSRALVRRATEKLLPDSIRLNETVRGVQGADWLHRILPNWSSFYQELQQIGRNDRMLEIVDGRVVEGVLARLRNGVQSADAYGRDVNAAMYLMILYRFLQKSA
ncbi:asparagine synthetase B [Paenibacillus sp. 1011MAR3C5]|uniref:asparagine synthase-related protein n=1 Tax=Paenibacillus sp. 1011MAR3C5 TaxID=1675787 RepID=UPI000E6D4ACE|nr:asparagine synthase-related protein [Paenibacillus sp. 1011MAR3C5]RJE91142.1 asparagine synthetase B [Paenibacillus sp. 1011MAR3C5]